MTNWRDEYDTAIVERNKLIQENVALRAELDAARLNEWDTAPEGEHVMVTLRTVGWRVAGLWEWDDNGYWDVLGWQPLPDAPGDGGEEAGNPLDRLLPTGENVIAGIKRVQMWNSPAPGDGGEEE